MIEKSLYYRLISTTSKDPLIRAIGLHKQKKLKILDCTGGLGVDSAVMAQFGANVTVLEGSKAIYDRLIQNLALVKSYPLKKSLVIEAHHSEALEWIKNNDIKLFDVIYCDPMFPHKKKSAKPKQSMQELAQITPYNEKSSDLLIQNLIDLKPKKLVIKRPIRAAQNPLCHHHITGKTHRFDVFINK